MNTVSKAMINSRKSGRPDAYEAARIGEAILAAAEAAFLTSGFSKASVQAIAAAAGTSKQTVFARFGSKERLFIAVSDALLKGRFSPMPASVLPLRERLIDVAAQALDAMLDPRMVMMSSIITGEAKRFPELAQLANDDATFAGRDLMRTVIAEAVDAGELRCQDPGRAMLMLQDMVLSSPLRAAVAGQGDMDAAWRQAWVSEAVDLFLNGLRPRAV